LPVLPQGRVGVGAVPSEHLEGQRGDAQGQGGSRKANCLLRPRRGHLPVVRFRTAVCPDPVGHVNPMRASVDRPVSAGSVRQRSRCPSLL
jgi:hypothetical protein